MGNDSKVELSGSEFFDYWSKLAKEDPERFEIEREEVIRKTISQVPVEKRSRLWLLQSEIDALRAQAGDPLVACAQLNRLMFERLFAEDGLFSNYSDLMTEYLKFLKQFKKVADRLSSGKPDASMLS